MKYLILITTSMQCFDITDYSNYCIDSKLLKNERIHIKNEVRYPRMWLGVWKIDKKDNNFKRSFSYYYEWKKWADIEVIPSKKTKKRIILIGESVARGFYYDPHLNTAKLLEYYLDGEYEVIDFAKNDLTFEECLLLLKNSQKLLDPDKIILFAGNNWSKLHFDKNLINKTEKVSIKEYQEKLSTYLKKRLRKTISTLSCTLHIIIPEFNLGNWVDSEKGITKYIDNFSFNEWWKYYEKAKKDIRDNRSLEKLMDIDKGLNPHSLFLMGKHYEDKGHIEKAKTYYKKSLDTTITNSKSLSPRCYSIVQQILKDLKGPQIQILDLPSLFSEDNALLNQYFLDYCHLSFLGMDIMCKKLSMQITSKKINALNFKVDNDFINMSLFLSAIHNAHWGQPYERVTQLMQKATLSKKVKKIAESYFQEKYKLLPEYFTHYAIPARLKILFEKYIYSYDKSNLVDIILLQAYKKIGFKEDILNVLLKSVEIRYLPDDLVRNYIRPVNLDNNYPSTARNYYYSSLPISKFHFIHGANKDISCNLTCKINSKTRRTIKIYCNDVLIDTILISENWETYVLKISKNMVLKGTNSLEIEWPITDTMNHKSLTSFGDIYNLKLL